MWLTTYPLHADLAQRVLKKLRLKQKQTSAGASKAGQLPFCLCFLSKHAANAASKTH